MTPLAAIEAERLAFEAEMLRLQYFEAHDFERDHYGYTDDLTATAWLAWQAARAMQQTAEPVKDAGPWRYGTDLGRVGFVDRYFVESNDFTHDVRLYINGDFADDDQRKHYGENLAAKLNAAPDRAPSTEPSNCDCETCQPLRTGHLSRMVLCATCGNKRCPHATDHRNACTNSNEPGQVGSSYGPARAPSTAYADCCDTPLFCSAVRRCTAKDGAPSTDSAAELAAASKLIAAYESLMVGCTNKSWAEWTNGNGTNVGKRIEAARKAYKAITAASIAASMPQTKEE